jgi:hypothetical protein
MSKSTTPDDGPDDWVRRIQLQELSRAPAPGRLRAADVLEVNP